MPSTKSHNNKELYAYIRWIFVDEIKGLLELWLHHSIDFSLIILRFTFQSIQFHSFDQCYFSINLSRYHPGRDKSRIRMPTGYRNQIGLNLNLTNTNQINQIEQQTFGQLSPKFMPYTTLQ